MTLSTLLTRAGYRSTRKTGYKKKSKISELRELFKSGGDVDSIRINVLGDVVREGKYYLLDGDFHLIDGQQRMYALKDVGVRNLNIPVELYINLDLEEERQLYEQFNMKQSKLTSGEAIQASSGPIADHLRKMKKRRSMPIKVTTNPTTGSLGMSQVVLILMQIAKFHEDGLTPPGGIDGGGRRAAGQFLRSEKHAKKLMQYDYTMRKLMEMSVEIFGGYSSKLPQYKKGFLYPFYSVVLNNFVNQNGNIEVDKKFSSRFDNIGKVACDGHFNHTVKGTIGAAARRIAYDFIIKELNAKMRSGRLKDSLAVEKLLDSEED